MRIILDKSKEEMLEQLIFVTFQAGNWLLLTALIQRKLGGGKCYFRRRFAAADRLILTSLDQWFPTWGFEVDTGEARNSSGSRGVLWVI